VSKHSSGSNVEVNFIINPLHVLEGLQMERGHQVLMYFTAGRIFSSLFYFFPGEMIKTASKFYILLISLRLLCHSTEIAHFNCANKVWISPLLATPPPVPIFCL